MADSNSSEFVLDKDGLYQCVDNQFNSVQWWEPQNSGSTKKITVVEKEYDIEGRLVKETTTVTETETKSAPSYPYYPYHPPYTVQF